MGNGWRTRNHDRYRETLFRKQKGKCCWCKCTVVPPPRGISQNSYKVFPNMATVDHLYHKWDLRRDLETSRTRVLSCFKCNQERRFEMTEEHWFKVEIIDIRDMLNIKQ